MKNEGWHIALHLYCGGPSFGGAERRLLRAYGEVAKRVPVDLIVRESRSGVFEEACAKANIATESFYRLWRFSSKHHFLTDAKALFRCFDSMYTNQVFFDYSRFNHVLTTLNKLFTKSKMLFIAADYRYALRGKGSSRSDNPRGFESLVKKVDWVDVLYPTQQKYYSGITDARVTITPGTFTDLEMFKPGDKGKIISFLSARLDRCKNPMLLVASVEMCQEQLRSHGYKVILCGTGVTASLLSEEVNRKELRDLIIMPGYVASNALLPKSEIVCVLSEEENYPSQVIAEGCASGCYILATNVGSTSRIVHSDFGTLVDCDAVSVSKALVEYVEKSDSEKKDIASAARNFALSNFDIRRTVDYFLDIIVNDKCDECSLTSLQG